jgi:hypothetical protein
LVSGSAVAAAIFPAVKSRNGTRPRRGGVTGENFSPSAPQVASSTPDSLLANSSSSLHLARSAPQATVLSACAPLAAVTVLGNVTRNSRRISPFFFWASSIPGTWNISISPSGFICAAIASVSPPLSACNRSVPFWLVVSANWCARA